MPRMRLRLSSKVWERELWSPSSCNCASSRLEVGGSLWLEWRGQKGRVVEGWAGMAEKYLWPRVLRSLRGGLRRSSETEGSFGLLE
jgi:hypothetical protein